MAKLNVLVVDDHQQILDAIQEVLRACPEVGKIDIFKDGNSAHSNLYKNDYDLCIIDLRLPGMDGFKLIDTIRKINSGIKVIINTMCDEVWNAKHILNMNVEGVVLKHSALSHLKEAIDTVLAGDKYHCPKFQEVVKQQGADLHLKLSQLELQILYVIAKGLSTKEISHQYSFSENTIESIRKRLMVKLEVRNMAQLIDKAHKTGLMTDYNISD